MNTLRLLILFFIVSGVVIALQFSQQSAENVLGGRSQSPQTITNQITPKDSYMNMFLPPSAVVYHVSDGSITFESDANLYTLKDWYDNLSQHSDIMSADVVVKERGFVYTYRISERLSILVKIDQRDSNSLVGILEMSENS